MLVAKTPVAGIILSVVTLYGLWLVATTTVVPEFISAAAQLSDDGVYFADFPATPGTSIARVSLVDGNGKRFDAELLRRESTAARTQVWARADGRIETPNATMELAVGERSLLSYAVAVPVSARPMISPDPGAAGRAEHGNRLAFAWRMARGDRMAWVTSLVNALFTHFFRALLPIVYALVVDQVITHRDLSLVPSLALCFAMMLAANEVLFAIGHVSWVYKVTDFDAKVRRRIFRRILSTRSELLERRKTGDLAETVESDAQQITWYVDVFGIWIPDAFIGLVIALLFMAAISPLLALLAAIAAPLTAVLAHLIGLRGRRVADAYRTRYGGYSSWLFEIIRGAADLQQLGATTTAARWLVARLRGLIHLKVRQSLVELSSERVRELVATVLEIAFFVAVSALVLSDRLTIGGYIAVATYFLTARFELSELSDMLYRMRVYSVGVDRVRDVVDLPPEDDSGPAVDAAARAVVFENVRFRYRRDEPVLEGVSLRVAPGEQVAIVGGSGAGKSSIVTMLARLRDPESGSVMIGAHSVAHYSRTSVRRWFGFVQQDPLIFSDTVRANLCPDASEGGGDVSDDRLWEACRVAQISDTVGSFPDGLDTLIGSDGRTLSAGEKQRLELARVLLRQPTVLVIDEGLSAVDPDTERSIYRRLFGADERRSTIIIAHRLSSIIDCERILVLNRGVIAASGSHAELIRDCTAYRQLFEEQIE